MTVSVMMVDDSSVARLIMTCILQKEGSITVCGTAANGADAIELAERCKPDVITMDLNMPGLNGLEVTKRILEKLPVPIIIVTTDKTSAANPFSLLEAGAVAVLQTPAPPGHPEHEQSAAQFIRTIRALAGIKIGPPIAKRAPNTVATSPPVAPGGVARCVAIGASTGGPQLIREILSGLPAGYPLPIIITQHLAKGFSKTFIEWLNTPGGVVVKLAEHGEKLLPGHAYLAPDDRHLGVTPNKIVDLSDSTEFRNRPAVAYMFKSMGKAFGKNCVAVLLTGMGSDGAEQMKDLRDVGALTIAQDKESSLIHGMAAEAIKKNGACEILPPDKIIKRLISVAQPANTSAIK